MIRILSDVNLSQMFRRTLRMISHVLIKIKRKFNNAAEQTDEANALPTVAQLDPINRNL